MGLNKFYYLSLIIFFTTQSFALDCRIVEKFADPKLSGNTHFWQELGQLEEQTDEAVAALIKKHDSHFNFSGKESVSNAVKEFKIPETFNVSKKSEKAMKSLNSNQKKNFEEFINTVSGEGGIKNLYKNPGKWHFEKLKQYGGATSIRLDDGMRVLFNVEKEGLHILDIGKHIGH